jgi:glycosyltransferase involved in cell wall biosynthesis
LNEERNIRPCYDRIREVFESIHDADFQLIFVDDGSNDETLKRIHALISIDSRCGVIVNARNYGVYRSSFHALRYASGDVVIPMMPVDLQDPPELIPKLLELWRQGNLVVAGARYEREENWIMRSIRRSYYRLASRLADFDLPKYVGEFQLLDKSIVRQLCAIDDYYPYIRGLIASLTNQRAIVPYTWKKREIGKSNMNLRKLVDQGLNGIVSTSTVPLRVLSLCMLLVAIGGIIFGIVQIIAHLSFSSGITEPGISTIIILTSLFGASSAICFGVLSEYVGAIHAQVRGRLRVIERHRVNLDAHK